MIQALNDAVIPISMTLHLGGPPVLKWLGKLCGVKERLSPIHTVTMLNARKFAVRCLLHQMGMVTAGELDGAVWQPLDVATSGAAAGLTSVHLAAELGSSVIIDMLIRIAKDSRNLQGVSVPSPAHIAATAGHPGLVKRLIAAGLNDPEYDHWGRKPEDIACMQRWRQDIYIKTFGERPECKSTKAIQVGEAEAVRYSDPGGGWRDPPMPVRESIDLPETCGFDTQERLTPEQFIEEYLSVRRPVRIRGKVDGLDWEKLRSSWERKKLSSVDTNISVTVFSASQGDRTIQDRQTMPLRTYIHSLDAVFSGARQQPPRRLGSSRLNFIEKTVLDNTTGDMLELMVLPAAAASVDTVTRQRDFYVGPAGSGPSPRTRTHRFDVLVYGRKEWAVFRPSNAIQSRNFIGDWFPNDFPKLVFFFFEVIFKNAFFSLTWQICSFNVGNGNESLALRCIQEPGDVIFVPHGWGHAAMHLAESVGYSVEFDWLSGSKINWDFD